MSRADELFIANMHDILKNGVWDTDLPVRPKWSDGAPAHTVKKFGIVNRYNLQEEFPILTIRRTAFKSCIDELLWIWQKKSNNIRDLKSHIWDQWADGNGSIGKAYGYQLGVKHKYKEGEFILMGFGIAWFLLLVLSGVMTVHNYTLGKTLLTIIFTFVAMLIIVFVVMLLYTLLSQVVSFFVSIYNELMLRI